MISAKDVNTGHPGFCSTKQQEVFLLPPEWVASPSQGYPTSRGKNICGLGIVLNNRVSSFGIPAFQSWRRSENVGAAYSVLSSAPP